MRSARALVFVVCVAVLGGAAARAQTPAAGSAKAPAAQADIERALSAAPPAVAAGAAVAEMDDMGRLKTLRPGTNGWTCMPTDPGSPVPYPVCVDQSGLTWFQAALAGKPPDPDLVGYSYMLEGGSAWSVLDPAATALPKGEKAPVTVPPHIMILNARIAMASGFPSGDAHPDTHKPFVLYGGTPFAILIIPVS